MRTEFESSVCWCALTGRQPALLRPRQPDQGSTWSQALYALPSPDSCGRDHHGRICLATVLSTDRILNLAAN